MTSKKGRNQVFLPVQLYLRAFFFYFSFVVCCFPPSPSRHLEHTHTLITYTQVGEEKKPSFIVKKLKDSETENYSQKYIPRTNCRCCLSIFLSQRYFFFYGSFLILVDNKLNKKWVWIHHRVHHFMVILHFTGRTWTIFELDSSTWKIIFGRGEIRHHVFESFQNIQRH